MLSAKAVTFQIFDYSRNFLSCCSQVLGANHSFRKGGVLQVEYEGRSVVVMTNHFVVPFQWLLKRLETEGFQANVRSIRERFPDKTIIASFDRCDRFAGLTLKLRAFHQFLSEYSQYRSKLVLLQFVSKYTEDGSAEDTSQLMREVQRMATEINKEFSDPNGPPSIEIKVQDMDGDSRLAMMQAADILLDTSINDGLNLSPCMFLSSHASDKRGAVIVSEFCGCSSALTGAYKVNPWDTRKVMRALDEALSGDSKEQADRFEKDFSYVSTQSMIDWVIQNMAELKAATAEDRSTQLAGLAAGFQMRITDTKLFQQLNFEMVLNDYKKAKARAIFLDYEGTIASRAGWKHKGEASGIPLMNAGQPPDSQVLEYLQALTADRGNTVVILSGRKTPILDEWFQQVQGIGLCAEHGFHWVLPSTLKAKLQAAGEDVGNKERWQDQTNEEYNDGWKDVVFNIFKQYVKRVQGSRLEQKTSCITWHYREVGTPTLTNQFAVELARFLDPMNQEGVMYGLPVKVVIGKGYVEVKRSDVDKGVAVTRIIRDLKRVLTSPIDFALCIGDDRSDEDMFEAVNSILGTQDGIESPKGPISPRRPSVEGGFRPPPRRGSEDDLSSRMTSKDGPKFYTVVVGRKPSKAKFFVKDVSEVTELLHKLSSQAVASSFSKYSSAPDLASLASMGGQFPDSDSADGAEA